VGGALRIDARPGAGTVVRVTLATRSDGAHPAATPVGGTAQDER
jgi:hypothetical protein